MWMLMVTCWMLCWLRVGFELVGMGEMNLEVAVALCCAGGLLMVLVLAAWGVEYGCLPG